MILAGEEDFDEALRAMGGCAHVGLSQQNLAEICERCRILITKLVLLRDHYRADPQHFR